MTGIVLAIVIVIMSPQSFSLMLPYRDRLWLQETLVVKGLCTRKMETIYWVNKVIKESLESLLPSSFIFALVDRSASSFGYYLFLLHLWDIFPFLCSTYYCPKTRSHCLLPDWCSCLQTFLEPWFSNCGSPSNSITVKPHSLLDRQHLKHFPDLLNPGAHSLPGCMAYIQCHLLPPTSFALLGQCVFVLPLEYFLVLIVLTTSFVRGG